MSDVFTQIDTAARTSQADIFSQIHTENAATGTASRGDNAAVRFASRATGLPVRDILRNPSKYLDPFSDEYQQATKDNVNQPVTAPTLRDMTPFGQTVKDIGDKNYAGAAGDLAPGVLAAASMARFRLATPEVIPPRALPAGPREMPGTIEASPSPAYSPTTRAQRLNLLLPEQAGGRIPLPASTAEVPAETEASYPGALNKRPTDRAEITSDKAVEDTMRNDLEKQGWRALSQERKEFYANNQPGMSKGDLVTNARVEAVRTAAEQQVQKILAESNPPVKYSKTVTPKAKVAAAAQPVSEDLNSPNRLIDLMQQSIDAVNARKGK